MKVEHFSEALERSLDRVATRLPENAEKEKAPESRAKVIAALKRVAEEEAETSPKEEDHDELPSYFHLPEASVPEKTRRAVEELIAKTSADGLLPALKLARRADPFVEDAFHDALVEHILPKLKERGLI